MADTSIDLEQLRRSARDIRAIAEGDLTAFINEQSHLVDSYRMDASLNTVDGTPAGIYQDTAAALADGIHDASTKCNALKTMLLDIAAGMEAHADGVESDESDAAQKLTYSDIR